ncbi:hypothetical protein [Tenacibaculum crassostreae]|uniref:hypothetical protein n=1 Tax=Tenacibaculum crassostreae TaxID=502683 RepID=UPI0038959377
MKKSILKLGKVLGKKDQKNIKGGTYPGPYLHEGNNGECPWNQCMNIFGRCTMFCD